MIKKYNTLLIVLLFFIAVGFTSGCSPIGSLLADSGKTPIDYIRAEPKKFLYSHRDRFKPKEDVNVYRGFGGEEELIPIEDIKFKISYNSEWTGEQFSDDVDIINGTGFRVENIGILRIDISYKDMKTFYQIQVDQPGTGKGSGWPNGPVDTIYINWD
jgi:hypothetical protein